MENSRTPEPPCTLLAWDSEFWGFPVARLNSLVLREGLQGSAIKWGEENGIRCLYLLADGTDPETLWRAAQAGFQFVDIRTDLECAVSAERTEFVLGGEVRPIVKDDLELLQGIARTAHHDSRFFKDRNFDRGRCAELYAKWIERDFMEGNILGFFQGDSGKPSGYISFSSEVGHVARIGLIAIEESQRGKGAGWKLVAGAIEAAARQGAEIVRVATQGTNVAALKLYEKAGFRVCDAKIWFHKWFPMV